MDRVSFPKIPSRKRILIVDDDLVLLDMLQSGLSVIGYTCETAADGATALESIRKSAFHAMVSDIVLPDINGFDLAKKVRTSNSDIAVILMTGLSGEFSYEDAMKAGASDFIKKPFSMQELAIRIEHAMVHENLYRISLHDDLTGLYNRRGFFTLADHLLKMARRKQEGFYMLYADLDDLKKINDAFGHQKGDLALIDTANILKENFRDSDIVARIGGDEFVVMPIGTSGDSIEAVIGRLQEAVEKDNANSSREYELSLSTGTAFYDPCSSCTIDELLHRADKSMYEQKAMRKRA